MEEKKRGTRRLQKFSMCFGKSCDFHVLAHKTRDATIKITKRIQIKLPRVYFSGRFATLVTASVLTLVT
jgi:hypothetical protein